MYSFKTYLRNTAWLYFDKVLGVGVSFLTGIAVARYLGPDQMGVWGYAISLSTILAAFGSLGLQQIAIRDLVSDPIEYKIVLGSIIGLRFIGGMLAFLGLVSIALATEDFNVKWLLICLGATHLFLAFDSYDFYFQAKVQARYGVFVRLARQMILAGAKLILIHVNAPLLWFGVATLAAEIIQSALFIATGSSITKIGIFQLRFVVNKAKYFLAQCWPLILSGLATSIYLEIDKVMLKQFMGDATVGQYTVSSNIVIASMFLISVICQSFYPMIIHAKKMGEDFYKKRLVQLYSISVWVGILLGGGLALLAGWFVPFLLGAIYIPAVPIIQVLSVLGVFTSITLVSSFWLLMENLQSYSFYRNMLGMALNIVLNFLLIPQYGAIGAAVASVATRAIATICFMGIMPKFRNQLGLIFKSLNPFNILNKQLFLNIPWRRS